jgi:tetratricopeptide (TPR) repeat protein
MAQEDCVLRKVLLLCWLLMPAAALSASDEDFYQRLYQRGMTHFAAADYAAAFTELRSAAFGFVERVEQFEMAQSYACLAAHRLGRDSEARDSLMRIVTAEKLQPRYRTLKLPDDVRAEVNAVAANVLTEQEAVLLGVTAAVKPAVAVPTPTKQPNVAVTAPRDGGPDAAPPTNDPKPAPKPVTPAPVPQPKKPVPQPSAPVPQPQPKPPAPTPQSVAPTPQPPDPKPDPAPKTPQPAVRDVVTSLADAQRAIDSGDINRARSIYDALSSNPSLSHDAALRVAEGLYRVRDFAGAAKAFVKAGAIGRGEEGYHYYYAVALYETGRYANAKRELAAGLPYVTITPDVARYRAKIEGAIE